MRPRRTIFIDLARLVRLFCSFRRTKDCCGLLSYVFSFPTNGRNIVVECFRPLFHSPQTDETLLRNAFVRFFIPRKRTNNCYVLLSYVFCLPSHGRIIVMDGFRTFLLSHRTEGINSSVFRDSRVEICRTIFLVSHSFKLYDIIRFQKDTVFRALSEQSHFVRFYLISQGMSSTPLLQI